MGNERLEKEHGNFGKRWKSVNKKDDYNGWNP